jgi:hypothetical protein
MCGLEKFSPELGECSGRRVAADVPDPTPEEPGSQYTIPPRSLSIHGDQLSYYHCITQLDRKAKHIYSVGLPLAMFAQPVIFLKSHVVSSIIYAQGRGKHGVACTTGWTPISLTYQQLNIDGCSRRIGLVRFVFYLLFLEESTVWVDNN